MKKMFVLISLLIILVLTGCSTEAEDSDTLVLYSGRSESLVSPVIDRFIAKTGIQVEVRYGGTAEMAATLLEEGKNSPADLFWAQDPGGLGAVAAEGLFTTLPDDIRALTPENFQSPDGLWIGITGRARVVVYNTGMIDPAELPDDIWDFTDPKWDGKIGWAPTNGSFQVMITAMRSSWGEEKTAEWLKGILANNPVIYENNTGIVAGVEAGEVEVGFVNHYYLFRFLAEEGEDFEARNYFLPSGGPGSLVMVAGAGILESSNNKAAAEEFLRYLLSSDSQEFFVRNTYEYPMSSDLPLPTDLAPLETLNSLRINLADLDDLNGTVSLLQSVGALP